MTRSEAVGIRAAFSDTDTGAFLEGDQWQTRDTSVVTTKDGTGQLHLRLGGPGTHVFRSIQLGYVPRVETLTVPRRHSPPDRGAARNA